VESGKTKEKAEWARQRSSVYGLLSNVYLKELTKEQLEQLREPEFVTVLSGLGVQLGNDFLKRPDEEELFKDLAVEYAALFLGPGKHISPHESVHHERKDGDRGRLWGAATVEVKKFIEWSGLTYQSEYKGIPDHIGVELEFMHSVTEREAQVYEEGNIEGVIRCMEIEQKFIEEHLYKWIPVFCDKITSVAEHSFYREIAKLTKSFVEFEKREVGKRLSELELNGENKES
jgi:TorA maturation chaperone TorD